MLDGARGLAKGFWTTLRHAAQPPLTVPYPEVKRPVPAAFRGRHRLFRHEDGLERCIGCELCAAACPSSAIYVLAADNDPAHPVSTGERFAAVYEINMIRCIFCGYCEEACPVQAIVLGPEYELSDTSREQFVYTKEMLLEAQPPGVPEEPLIAGYDPGQPVEERVSTGATHQPLSPLEREEHA